MKQHSINCECKGKGTIYLSHGCCSCGKGEGCDQHDEFWMKAIPCNKENRDALQRIRTPWKYKDETQAQKKIKKILDSQDIASRFERVY